MTTIGSPACPLGRLEGLARGGGEGEGRCRLSCPPPKGATPCDRPPRGALLIPRPLGVVDYFGGHLDQSGPPRAGETSSQGIALTPRVEEPLAVRLVDRLRRQFGRQA